MKKNPRIFSFVSDREFRSVLEADYDELYKCVEAGCSKSALIIAGSILECLATFSLQTLQLWPSNNGDIFRAPLGKIIEELHQQGIIKSTTRDLSAVIREFRNLIHPGKMIRSKAKADMYAAEISASLVNIIAEEIAATFSSKYGLTADQLMQKVKKDPSAANLAKHYLKHMSDSELVRIVIELIPNEVAEFDQVEVIDECDFDWHKRYLNCLRSLFTSAIYYKPHVTLAAFAALYVNVIKNGTEDFIDVLDRLLFKGELLKHLGDDDYDLVKDHWMEKATVAKVYRYSNSIDSLSKGLKDGDIVEMIYRLASEHSDCVEEEKRNFILSTMAVLIPYYGGRKEEFLVLMRDGFRYLYHKDLIEQAII